MHLLLVVLILMVLMTVLAGTRHVLMMVMAVWGAHLVVLIVHARDFFFSELSVTLVFEI